MRPRVPFVSNPFGAISRNKVVKTKPRSRLRNDDAQPSTCTYCLRHFFLSTNQSIRSRFVSGQFPGIPGARRLMGLKGRKKKSFNDDKKLRGFVWPLI